MVFGYHYMTHKEGNQLFGNMDEWTVTLQISKIWTLAVSTVLNY